VPRSWGLFEIDKDFRGCHLHIVVHNDEHRESGCRRLLVNGKEVPGNYIPEELLTKATEVEMWM
jgi:cellobiose phosphorylase